MGWPISQNSVCLLTLVILGSLPVLGLAEEPRECREQEFKDKAGRCVACQQCDAGQELSEECGFGYGQEARCVPCRPGRFKEDGGTQKCKPCLDCGHINRFQKANCSSTGNAACGACLPGFYRKTKLSGFQDMECVPCGNPPPPYEPHCGGRVNLVPIQATVTSPRDMALAAVICSALASVLLALLILCVIYCKRQLLEKKPRVSVRSQDSVCNGAELSCFDRRLMQTCCHCHQGPVQAYGPVPLLPSLCCEETCSLERGSEACPLHSRGSLGDGLSNPVGGSVPLSLSQISDSTGMEPAETWTHTSNSESLDCSHCYLEERESPLTDSSAPHGQTSTEEEPPYPQFPERTVDQPSEDQANTRSSSPTESHPISQNSLQE
ncbi:tumor necrosis factor receptor superfamily member 19-like [Conger conger]|uniref:tumor necrosis factor receptor superfamily member 19-like n=1 Tax=Conger conger TaxID=82655 RepID=UPI002A5A0062|nr:tumor necrosis factor receptor superfamily member 19-like [Conger conger]XP_061106496.1 tumor necrosis factor receptor superfamily member 19-like [Conger conger]XP_061106497.1 tumor necrosis factor receptor superfamily member 19-like [Conger conger]